MESLKRKGNKMKNVIQIGDCREVMRQWKDQGVLVQTCVTSPPYFGLRDYRVEGQLGLEKTPEEFVENLVEVFRCVWDILKDDGTLWLVIGDSYAGSGKNRLTDGSSKVTGKQSSNKCSLEGNLMKTGLCGLKKKDLIGIPWRVAFALQADGWYLRQDIIWHKPNPMPESVTDRCTKAHEYIFLFSKNKKYYYDHEAIKEKTNTRDTYSRDRGTTKLNNTPGRSKMKGLVENDYEFKNKRSVWTVTSKPYSGTHYATFPPDLILPCILAGSKIGDIVFDPFIGSGTTGKVAKENGRNYLGIDLDPENEKLQKERIGGARYQLKMFY